MDTFAIVGRPNVGKSTLFNKLTGKSLALVDAAPGITRDRRRAPARLGDLNFTLIDTPGWALEGDMDASLASGMREQTLLAMEQSNAVLFVVDGQEGPNAVDLDVLDQLRRKDRPFLLVINKCESAQAKRMLTEFWSLNIPDFVALSAAHSEGFDALYEGLVPLVHDTSSQGEHEPRFLRMTVLGRPNVGKSTLINHLIGEDRLLTSPTPGATSDAVLVSWTQDGRRYELVDTAGIRRRTRSGLEHISLGATRRALRLTQVACLVVSAAAPFEKQDLLILSHILKEGRAPLLLVNKCDLRSGGVREWRTQAKILRDMLPQARGTDIVVCSALDGRGIKDILPAAAATVTRWSTRVETGRLNRWLRQHIERHALPRISGKQLKIRYATQVSARPPNFTFFSNMDRNIPQSYIQYLANGLRRDFDLDGMPIRIHIRKSGQGA